MTISECMENLEIFRLAIQASWINYGINYCIMSLHFFLTFVHNPQEGGEVNGPNKL